MIKLGVPSRIRLKKDDLVTRNEAVISSVIIRSMGTIAEVIGMSGSPIGEVASSEIRRVAMSSESWSSPICRFPVRRMKKTSKR